MNLGVYVHIPFCKTKCPYCDFISLTDGEKLFEPYINTLLSEIKTFDFSDYEISTVFIGGGTPTVLPPSYIAAILDEILKNKARHDVEVTIEANPNTVTKEFLKAAKDSGANRISVGLQAWQKRLLQILGRSHSADDFLKACELINAVGFNNANADLMFSVPTQTWEDLEESIERVIATGFCHISLYSLIIEENTKFYDLYKEPEETLDRHLYHNARNLLKQKGSFQYEISNFAKKGFECRHNLDCWNREDYIGFGTAAHSLLKGKRFHNACHINDYILKNERQDIIELSQRDAMEEFMFLGLRKVDGIEEQRFNRIFNTDIRTVYGTQISKYVSIGFMSAENGRLFLTDKGMDLANIIFSEFLF